MNVHDMFTMYKGNFSRKGLYKYLIVYLGIAFVFVIIAAVTMSVHRRFSFLETQISWTGDPGDNPDGWIFLSIALWFGGAFMYPLVFFLHRSMLTLDIKGHRVVSFLYVMGATGIFMVGLFPSAVSYPMHITSAVMAFGGFSFGFLVFFGIAVRDRLKKFLWPYFVFIPLVGIIIVTQAYSIAIDLLPAEGTIFSIALWEWTLFFTVIFMLVALVLIFSRERSK